jgi:hypothetical protein
MSRRRARQGLLGSVAAAAIGASGVAGAGDEALKESMGKALESLQPLLVALVSSDYEAALEHVGPILGHASVLTKTIPDSAKANQDQYLAYVYNLRKNGEILKSTVEMILGDEKAKTGPSTDYLPVVAATHYGGVVNMCVACHNRFRIPLEK